MCIRPHLSTASTDPGIASPPPCPLLYNTPVISSNTPSTLRCNQLGLARSILTTKSVNVIFLTTVATKAAISFNLHLSSANESNL